MSYIYTFTNNNVTINGNTTTFVALKPKEPPPAPRVIDNNFYNLIYNDNIINIIYYDEIYFIKIMVNDAEFEFIDVPWDFILKADSNVTNQIKIKDSEFNKSITISVDNILFTNCDFSVSDANPDDPGSSLILYNNGIINLYLTDCNFLYDNRVLPIDGIAKNIITSSGSSMIIKPIANESEKIQIYNLFYLYNQFTFILDPDNVNKTPFRFTEISTNMDFKLNGDVTIENTFITRHCSFNLNGSDLTFSGCTFDNNINDDFLCTTYNDDSINNSTLNFTKYIDNDNIENYNILYPRKGQIYYNQLWNWDSINGNTISNSGNSNITPSDTYNFVKNTLTIPSNLTWLNNLYYFNKGFFELGATGSYIFGSNTSKLNQELNLLIASDTDLGNNTNELLLTVYSNDSLNIINNDGNTVVNLNPLTNITASEGRNCVNIGGNSYNKKIGIAGTYINSNNTFIDRNIDASIIGSVNLYITTDYNMTLENNYIIGTDNYSLSNILKTYIDGNEIDLIVGNTIGNTQNGKNYIFNNNNVSSLGNGTNIDIPCTFNMFDNLTMSGNLNNDCTFTNGNSLIPVNLTFDSVKAQSLPLINIYGNLYINTSEIHPSFNIINISNLEISSSTFYSDLFINQESLGPTIYGNITVNGNINGNSMININENSRIEGNGNINCYSKGLLIDRSILYCNLINNSNSFILGNSTINGNIIGNITDITNGSTTINGNTIIDISTINGTNTCTSRDFSISASFLNGDNTFVSQNLTINGTTLSNLNLNGSNTYYTSGNTIIDTCILEGTNYCKSEVFNILNTRFGLILGVQGNNTLISKTIIIGNSTITGQNNIISDYDISIPSELYLTISGNSTFDGVNEFNLRSFDISNTIFDGEFQILGNTTSGNGVTNLITDSIINDLSFIDINYGNLLVSNCYIDYITNEPSITLTSGTFNMGNSIITKNNSNTSNNNFNLTIGDSSASHTITYSQLECFNKINITNGTLVIDQSKLKANSYILSGGNINVTNSYVDSTDPSIPINILTGSVSPFVFTLEDSVIDIDENIALVSTFDGNTNFVRISNSTLNLYYNSPNMSTLTQDRDWFETNNIINFNSGTIYIDNYTNNKDIRISSNGNITIDGNNSDIGNSIINIYGLKKMKRTKSVPLTTNSVDIEIIDTTTTAVMTFQDLSMKDLFSTLTTEPKYYIDYQLSNNILGNTSGNISVDISNIYFYLTPNVYSVTSDLRSKLYDVPDYRLYVNGNGNYFIGYDQLVQLNTDTSIYQDIYFNSNIKSTPLDNVVLSGVDGNTLFNKRLVLNIEELNNTVELSLGVKSSGLNIFDNRTILNNRQTIHLNNSSIDISGNIFGNSSALNIESNTTNSTIIIGNSTFTTNNNVDNSISFINLISPRTSQDATSDRIVEINSSTWTGKAIYFIQNNDNTFLRVNSKPSNSNYISKNLIYWPYLNEMSRVTSPAIIVNPLSGTAIQFAQSWITDYVVPIYNNVSYETLNKGLSADWNDTIDTTNKCLKFVQAYSVDAFNKTLNNFDFSLTKTLNNTSTYHTGKFLSGISDTYSVSHSNNTNGFITADILFNSPQIVLMPRTNDVSMTFKVVYLDTTEESIFNKKIYTITNSGNITSFNSVKTIQEYLNSNFIIETSEFVEGNVNNNYDITMNDSTFSFTDGNIVLSAKKSQDAIFSINSFNGDNRFYFLTPVNINLSYDTIPINFSPVSPIIYPGIDAITNYGNYNYNKVNITLGNTPSVWTTARFNVELDSNYLGYYHTETNPLLSVTINNNITDTEIYGIKLGGNISSNYYDLQQDLGDNDLITVQKSLILDNPLFTAGNSTDIDNIYQWNYGAFGLVVPASSLDGNSNFIPSIENIKLHGNTIDNNILSAEHVIIELVKYTKNSNNVYENSGGNTITPSETDQLIRFMINVTVENVQEKYLDTDYDITFEINNSNGLTITPFNVTINYFRIPIIAKITENIVDNRIYRDTEFDIILQLSGRLNGNIYLEFQDTGTNTKDNLNPPTLYNYTTLINSSLKLIDGTTQNYYNNLIDMDGNNSKTITYEMIPKLNNTDFRIGNFFMNCIVSRITNTINTDYTIITSYNISNIEYIETLKNSIGITMKKLLNNGFETLNNVDFGSSTSNNKLLIIDESTNLIANSFEKKIQDVQGNYISGNIIDGNNYLTPINKFTRYYIAMDTTILGFNTNDNSSNNVITSFIFQNEFDVDVNDIEVIKMNGTVPVSTQSITLQYLDFQNFYNGSSYDDQGNDVLIFRRRPDSQQTYTTLKIYYSFTVDSNSNYKNLPPGPQLLSTIDYSGTSVTFADVSSINIGNFKIFPSGDGKYLMISNKASSVRQSIPNYTNTSSNIIDGILLQLPDV